MQTHTKIISAVLLVLVVVFVGYYLSGDSTLIDLGSEGIPQPPALP